MVCVDISGSFVSSGNVINAHRSGPDAMAGGDVADCCSNQIRLLARGNVTTGKGQDFGLGHAVTRGLDLPVLVWVLGAAAHVERDRAVEVAGDRRQIPALSVAAVFLDESRSFVEERCA